MFGESCYSLLVWPFKGPFSYHCSYPEKYFDFYRPVFLTAACSEDVCERDGKGANPSTTVVAVQLRAVRYGSTTLISPGRAHLTTSFCERRLLVGELKTKVLVDSCFSFTQKSNYIIIRMFKNNQNLAYVKQLCQMYVFLLSKVVWGEWDEFIIDEFSLEFKTKQF